MIRNAMLIICCTTLILLGVTRKRVFAINILTSFIDVHAEDIEPGTEFSLERNGYRKFNIINKGKKSVIVKLMVIKPSSAELMHGFDSISDPSWIRFEFPVLEIAPESTVYSDIILDIPILKNVYGKKYQAVLIAETRGEWSYIGGALSSNFYISVISKRNILQKLLGLFKGRR